MWSARQTQEFAVSYDYTRGGSRENWRLKNSRGRASSNGSRSQVERVRWCFWMWKGDHWIGARIAVTFIYDGKILSAEVLLGIHFFAVRETSMDAQGLYISFRSASPLDYYKDITRMMITTPANSIILDTFSNHRHMLDATREPLG